MMLASGSTSSRIWLAASSTSIRRMSSPPTIETMTPFAPRIDTPSSSGLAIAFSAAWSARPSPSASPVPIIALPISPMTERTSAKSRLMRPGMIMRSVIERTPCCSTSSAIWNASLKVVFGLAIRKRFWFGMTISVSTCFCSSSMPLSADFMRRLPSKVKGLVTTPTVRMPRSRAALAMTGAAPVPVPPPMPAVMKHICAPLSASSTEAIVSSAAALPISGRDPAPRPSVIWGPSWMRRSAGELLSACASVLATMKSTPSTEAAIMFAMALPPAPPTPITAMRGFSSST